MTSGELMEILCDYARAYCPEAKMSIARNSHMNEYQGEDVSQAVIDALIVDFVNFIGSQQCMDLGLYTEDLKQQPEYEEPIDPVELDVPYDYYKPLEVRWLCPKCHYKFHKSLKGK